MKRCLNIIAGTLDSLAQSPLKARALEAAKKQYLGQTIVAGMNCEQLALSTGRATLFYGRAITADEVIENINSITADGLRAAAERLSYKYCSTLTFE